MARKKKAKKKIVVDNYKHGSAKRKNIPTAKMAAEGKIPRVQKASYSYSPHLSPVLRFDPSGQSQRLSDIVENVIAGKQPTSEEANILRGVVANASQPWLEWSGKKEEHDQGVLKVEPVALHIHERVSANAIVRTAKRQDVQPDMFADPKQEYKEAIQFYQHDVDWANRLILGDSLEVMSSLTSRENLAGRVQMIYVDPPYGIKFASNFQSEVGKRDVKDKDADLTREPEMVKAYRDTWHLGIHSYASYLRDRLIACKQLLTESGSIFVQISDENLHIARQILDEQFGTDAFVAQIAYRTSVPLGATYVPSVVDYILWYAAGPNPKFRRLFEERTVGLDSRYGFVELASGERRRLTSDEKQDPSSLPEGSRLFVAENLNSAGRTPSCVFEFKFNDRAISPTQNKSWKTNRPGMERAYQAERLYAPAKNLCYVLYLDDYPVREFSNVWMDSQGASGKVYVVQTAEKIIARCMLMTTDPGDLVLDPTCGSGTTAYVAEKWGRRWITVDSSRVALSIARQRILTSQFDRYLIDGEDAAEVAEQKGNGVDLSKNFAYRMVPHITLGSIARNENLDQIFARHKPILNRQLQVVNNALKEVADSARDVLVSKLTTHIQTFGYQAVTDADLRRWLLPGVSKEFVKRQAQQNAKTSVTQLKKLIEAVPVGDQFEHWNSPFDVDKDWPKPLRQAVEEYRSFHKARMDEIRGCIDANAEQEVLVDQPKIVRDVVRVAGPFTVEGVRAEEMSLDENGQLFDPTPNEWEVADGRTNRAQNAAAYVDRMLRLIQQDGVTFPNNEHRDFQRVDRLEEMGSLVQGEGAWSEADDNEPNNIAIAFGPQHGPVTAEHVEDLVRASRRYDELVIAGFSFDGAAQAVIQESANPRLKIHMAHIRPDASPGMDGLLKDSPKSQLFTVFGQPEIEIRAATNLEDGKFELELLGVDIYSPLTGEITSSGAGKVAAWFLDSDYDGRCFCITQAFFPNQKAWDKIAKALGSSADAEAFEAYYGTVSLPFEPGEHNRIAVKVIDPRGNEAMAIRSLEGLS